MAWIESHQTLGKHPKLLRLSGILCIHKAQAVGHLEYLWWWALDYAPTGDLSAFASAEISSASEWPGDAESFHTALKDVGFIDKNGMIHDWMEYAGGCLKNKQRQRRFRALRYGNVTVTANQTVPDQTVPDQTVPDQTLKPLSPPFAQVAAFEDVWALYPSKDGRKAAERHFKSSVTTPELFALCRRALGNYLASDRVKKGYVKNGSTWFNNWQDWVDYIEPPKGDQANGRTSSYAIPKPSGERIIDKML